MLCKKANFDDKFLEHSKIAFEFILFFALRDYYYVFYLGVLSEPQVAYVAVSNFAGLKVEIKEICKTC